MKTTGTYISERITVPAEWEEIFSHFYYAVNHQLTAVRKTLLPSFQTIMVFNFGDPVRTFTPGKTLAVEKSVVLGPLKTSLDYEVPAGSSILVANLRLDAFYRFFGRSLQPYNEYLQHPDELLNAHCFSGLWQELKAISSMEHRVARILDFAALYIKEREASAADIVKHSEEDSPQFIADKKGQTVRNVQLNFKKYLGYSAKEISRYQRFQKAIDLVSSGETNWFEIIHQCGYYDQSHLIRDFSHYTGISPTQYLKLQHNICIALG